MNTINRIQILDESLAKKIAAGEVVERPASVIKELIENSIDADASNITVEIKDGGKTYISVSDNGSGILNQDMKLAFIRHATSKIHNLNDLYNIKQMGFRGEALYSISAVSKVKLISKTKESENGAIIQVDGGEIIKKHDYGCPNGTSIIIEDLFFNTPARLKFMKSNRAESGRIGQTIQKYILAYPEISFKFINNQKTIYHSNGDGSLKNSVLCVYGKNIASNINEFSIKSNDNTSISINGCLGNVNTFSKSRRAQSIYINRRYVVNKDISRAIEILYSQLTMKHVHPFFIINITIDPMLIDVNVHPQKLIVKFSDEKSLISSINSMLSPIINNMSMNTINKISSEIIKDSESLENTNFTNEDDSVKTNTSITQKNPPKINKTIPRYVEKVETEIKYPKRFMSKLDKKTIEPIIENPISSIDINEDIDISKIYKKEKVKIEQIVDNKKTINSAVNNIKSIKDSNEESKIAINDELHKYNYKASLALNKSKKPSVIKSHNAAINIENEIIEEKSNIKDYKIVGSIFSTYILVENNNKIYIIDQHAAHERLIYEKYMIKYNNNEKISQYLLIAQTLELLYEDILTIQENIEVFKELGFDLSIVDEKRIRIKAVPFILGQPRLKSLFEEIMEHIKQISYDESIIREKIISISCKKAIKAGDKLGNKEIDTLIKMVINSNITLTCPHGRPFIMTLSKKDIEKQFGRIQS